MRVQLHWQNPSNPSETIFVAEEEFEDCAAMEDWVRSLMHVRRTAAAREDEMPEGWCPMLCTEGSEHFKGGTWRDKPSMLGAP